MKSMASPVVYRFFRFFPGEPISTKIGITGITPFFALGGLCDAVSGEDEDRARGSPSPYFGEGRPHSGSGAEDTVSTRNRVPSLREHHSSRRTAETIEMAYAARFLFFERASFLRGHNLVVKGRVVLPRRKEAERNTDMRAVY